MHIFGLFASVDSCPHCRAVRSFRGIFIYIISYIAYRLLTSFRKEFLLEGAWPSLFSLSSILLLSFGGFRGIECECHVGAGDRQMYNQQLVV